jgi:putative hydrolase of the HAD superfamily
MERYGYSIDPETIVSVGKKIRKDAGNDGVSMTHTEVRLQAIKEEMRRVLYEKKLKECADDWATEVESLTAPLKDSAKKWAKQAVSPSVVESIYSAWERERHHSAERHLYPDVISALQKIKEEHPNVIIGAVTDGKANPMLMVFSLAPYFDFCMSWEDDAAGRMEFFKELGNVDGNAGLQWIYKAAYDKYQELAESTNELKNSVNEIDGGEPVWIHIGDDLAYDVGGSASCGAKTILLDLDEEYGQSAKLRFGENPTIPMWSTASAEELANREAMNKAAEDKVDMRVSMFSMLPDAIDEILKEQ